METVKSGVHTVLEGAASARYYCAVLDNCVVGQLMITTEWSDWRAAWVWWIQSVMMAIWGLVLHVALRQ